MRPRTLIASALVAVPVFGAGAAAMGAAPAPTAPTATTATTVAPTTTVPDRLVGVNWIQSKYASPCSAAEVQLIGGSAIDGANRVVLDDIVALDRSAGLVLAFLSCREPGGAASRTTIAVVRVRPFGTETLAERPLGPGARVVAVDAPMIVVEAPATAPPPGSCCAAVINRQTLTASGDGFTVRSAEQVGAFEQTVGATPAVGRDPELVRRSVQRAALCYRWDNVWLSATEEPAEPSAPTEPSAELQTLRLALIHLTGRWIEPTDRMNVEMAAVVTAYQQTRGLAVDGSIGGETTRALASDLGCPDQGEFTMVTPTHIGPRNFDTVDQLEGATVRYAIRGSSGSTSIDQLLADAGWDGRTAMFLGCSRWQAPAAGLSCSWSGATPLQLVGLVDDPAAPGLGGPFSILYARSTGG